MGETRLKTVSLVDALTSAITESIFNLEYGPGQQITEVELASRFNVSRNTVREAIGNLISCGLLEKEANKGVFVKEITQSDVRDIFHFRKLLESEAVRIIIQNGRVIPPELQTSMEKMEIDPLVQTNWYRYISSDLNFHYELVKASKSPRLIRLYDAIRQEIILCLCQTKNVLIVNAKNMDEHRNFLEVLQTGTEAECAELIMNHIAFGVENVARGFEK